MYDAKIFGTITKLTTVGIPLMGTSPAVVEQGHMKH